MASLSERLNAALTKRLYPSAWLSAKQLSNAIGVSEDSLARWRRGETRISAEKLLAVIAFFETRGDVTIRRELLEASPVRFWWATERGELVGCSDLAQAAGARLRLPQSVLGDAAAAVRRNLGWVSVAVAENIATVEYHDRGVSPAALAAVAEFVAKVAVTRRIVNVTDAGMHRKVEVANELSRDAIRSLKAAALFVSAPATRAWRVERLSLDRIMQPAAQRLATLASGESDLVEQAAKSGILPQCSMFHLADGVVTTLQVGSSSPLPQPVKESLVARPVMARADIRYAEIVRAHVLEAQEGPTYYWLQGAINGKPVCYRRPIFPCRGGLFLTMTEKVAA